jgi:peptidoglycan/xylan/chitin deacetylase (PgdA/CDA1 family)
VREARRGWPPGGSGKLGPEQLAREIEDTAALLESLTGFRPTAMRPPYGEQNAAVQAAAGTPLIHWSVDSRDWSLRNADKIYNRVMDQTADGDIILLHDIHAESIEAAKRIIPALKAQGYIFVTVDELIAARGGAEPGDVVYNRPPPSP